MGKPQRHGNTDQQDEGIEDSWDWRGKRARKVRNVSFIWTGPLELLALLFSYFAAVIYAGAIDLALLVFDSKAAIVRFAALMVLTFNDGVLTR